MQLAGEHDDEGWADISATTRVTATTIAAVIVLTHNQAPSHEWYNLMTESMYPLRPICINGVTANKCTSNEIAFCKYHMLLMGISCKLRYATTDSL